MAVSPTARAVLVGLAAAGFVVSAYLAYVSHRLQKDSDYQSLCAINAVFDCDHVVSSPYGRLLGTPLAWFAAWFYALFALGGQRARQRTWSSLARSPALLLVLASAFSVAVSVWLGGVSLWALQAVCILCATLYLINLALLVTSWSGLRSSGETFTEALAAERRRWKPRLLFRTASLVTFALLIAPVFTYRLLVGPSRFCELVATARPTDGRALTLTIYSDVQCPHCRALDQVLRPLRSARGLQLIYRQYPLDSACNPKVQRGGHPGACLQARALVCARSQQRFKEMSDRLFDGGPTDQIGIVQLGASLGLDERQFSDCLASPAAAREVAEDIASAAAIGVTGTPTILFEGGQRHVGRLTDEDLTCLAATAANARSPAPHHP